MMPSQSLLLKKSMKINSIKEAKQIIGSENSRNGFSDVTKMPCFTYSTSATMCKMGTKLRSIPGSACSGCYACPTEIDDRGAGGWYRSDRVQLPMNHKLLAILFNPRWTAAMIYLFSHYKWPIFRWHDSGDLQNDEHFENICKIADAVPETKFWLPTQEWGNDSIVERYWIKKGKIPLKVLHPNLIVRLSARMIDGPAPLWYARRLGVVTSRISKKMEEVDCPAASQANNCGACRKCWSNEVEQVTYHFHNGNDHFMKTDFIMKIKNDMSEMLDAVPKRTMYKQIEEKYHLNSIAVRVIARKLRIEMEKKLRVLD